MVKTVPAPIPIIPKISPAQSLGYCEPIKTTLPKTVRTPPVAQRATPPKYSRL